jgi:acyl dehydratase
MELAGLYARAALGALPIVGGGGGDTLPDLRPAREGVRADPRQLAEYDRVCGFRLRDELPSTYVHVLAFPLALRLLTDRSFPFGAMGLVHVANRIVQHRPLRLGEPFDLVVRAENLAPHPKGRTVEIVAEATVGDELAWEDVSTYLHRERAPDPSGSSGSEPEAEPEAGGRRDHDRGPDDLPERAAWTVPGDIGRRYAGVSGDRNPIHLHGLTAKAFGMPRAIAHGMWVKARCLAALEETLGDAYAVDVRFKLPLPIPGNVTFSAAPDGRFAVRSARDGKPHVEGRAAPR